MSNTNPHPRPTRWPWLAAAHEGGQLWLYDPRRIGSPVAVSRAELEAVQLFTSRLTVPEIHSTLAAKFGPTFLGLPALTALVTKLDESFLLDGPAFREYLAGPVRRPSCVGCYPPEPEAIHAQMRGLFTGPGGPGPVGDRRTDGPRLRAVLVPHMDYARGNVTYGWGFKELAERTDARLFVIVATSHYSPARFSLTRMNFATPLGTVETDQAYVDRILQSYGSGLFDDPFAHLPEHSVELEVVVLQHLFPDRPFRIVPLLVGSFGDCVSSLTPPDRVGQIQRMVAALQAAEAAAGEPVCYVISGDLAHIGPKFDDPEPVREPLLGESRKQDEAILAKLNAADGEGYFNVIAAEGDARRICGLPPTCLTLATARPTAGRVLHYQQFVHPQGHESVSFAAAAFYE
ncbi:AmmeMemoRadiSam system protein B [Limnoglobus roseus]|uniref:AmmeMemoRadiSam system protein B n=1 Tax=Limnoglobus roseus TaxID=2598579 RepID=A0A5C1AEX9_9BACT|nr:AmmeMemoRadiSam system protein B [Limnoglobus roseus]QEL16516.1 AmmeMemoRadiSam system protein B [Limnoglobus roseus]